jgi:transposase
MRKPFPEISESAETLDALLKSQTRSLLRNRVHALWLVKTGRVKTRTELADYLRVHAHTVGAWLTQYEAHGLDTLLEIATPGPALGQQRSISPRAFAALQERLQGEGFDSYIQIVRWLKEEWGEDVEYKTVWKIVRKGLQAKLKRARPVHAKKNPNTSLDG